MSKSFVTLEQKICVVCGKPYDTNTLLLDRRMRERFDMHTVTGVEGLCAEDRAKFDEGYVALVEVDPEKSEGAGPKMKMEDAYRTGTVVHIRRSVLADICNIPFAPGQPMGWITPDVTAMLKGMMPE